MPVPGSNWRDCPKGLDAAQGLFRLTVRVEILCIFERRQPIQVRTEQPIAAKRKRGPGRFFKQNDSHINWVLANAVTGEVDPITLTVMWNPQEFVMEFGESLLIGSWQSNRRVVNHWTTEPSTPSQGHTPRVGSLGYVHPTTGRRRGSRNHTRD